MERDRTLDARRGGTRDDGVPNIGDQFENSKLGPDGDGKSKKKVADMAAAGGPTKVPAVHVHNGEAEFISGGRANRPE